MRLISTPIEQHGDVWVKREDLCCPDGPPFSKSRGVLRRVASRPERLIGVLDTVHSKAGWAVAAACAETGKQCVNFYPKLKHSPDAVYLSQQKASELGAEIRPLQAGRSAVLYHQARRTVEARGGYMMPNALKLAESVEETAREVTREVLDFDSIVISISSGTIAAGVLLGMQRVSWALTRRFPDVWLHMGYTRSHIGVVRYLERFVHYPSHIYLQDEGYSYTEKARGGALPGFPCNEYYDLKAWQWLQSNRDRLRGSVLFWNIGA